MEEDRLQEIQDRLGRARVALDRLPKAPPAGSDPLALERDMRHVAEAVVETMQSLRLVVEELNALRRRGA